MDAVSPNFEQLGPHFALHSGTTQDMCLQNITGGIFAKLGALGPGQRFDNTLWFLILMQRLQTSQTHVDPTLHVGPNKIDIIKYTIIYVVRL